MVKCETMVSTYIVAIILVSHYKTSADVVCNDTCPRVSNGYNLTCTTSETFSNLVWNRGATKVMTCSPGPTGGCVPEEVGYTGYKITDSEYVLQIDSLDQTLDSGQWECDIQVRTFSCALSIPTDVPTGTLKAECQASGNSGHDVECSGVTNFGNPQVSLEIRDGSTVLASITSGAKVSSTQTGAGGKTYTCEVTGTAANCLSPSSVDVICPVTTPDPKKVCNYSTGFLAAEVIMDLVKIGLDVLVWKQKAPRWSIYVAAPIIVIISCVSVGLHFGSCLPLNALENEGVAVAAVVIAFLSIVFALINLIFCCCKKEEKLKVEESGAALKEVPKRNNPDKPDLEKGTSLSDVKVTNEEGKPKETPDMNKTDEDQKDMKRL